VLDAFKEKSWSKACSQLCTAITGMKTEGRAAHRGQHPQHLLQQCISSTLDVIRDHTRILDIAKEKQRSQAVTVPSILKEDGGDDADADDAALAKAAANEEDAALWMSVKVAKKVHMEAYNTLEAVRANPITWTLLDMALKSEINSVKALFCPLFQRFFDNRETMVFNRSELGFIPASIDASYRDSRSLAGLGGAIDALLPTLLPDRDFDATREQVRIRVQTILIETQVVPPGTQLAMYGSSRNNFGSNGADLDMCMVFPGGH